MNSIYVDKKQFDFAYNKGTAILITQKNNYSAINEPCLGQIINKDSVLIAVIYKIYDDLSSITAHEKDYCFSEALCSSDGCIGIKVMIYKTEQPKVTSLIPATLLLYHNIQWLRHLKLKQIFFKFIPTKETRAIFDYKVKTIEKTLDFLNGNITVEALSEHLSHDLDNNYFFREIIELLHLYPNPPKLNDFRKEKLNEISNTINEIKELYKNKKYREIQQAAYNIHNIPEIIRTMNNFR